MGNPIKYRFICPVGSGQKISVYKSNIYTIFSKLKLPYLYSFEFKLIHFFFNKDSTLSGQIESCCRFVERRLTKKCLNVDGSTALASQRPTCLETADARKGKASGSQPRQGTMLSVPLVLTLTADGCGVSCTDCSTLTLRTTQVSTSLGEQTEWVEFR